jgi:hypothetical protein
MNGFMRRRVPATLIFLLLPACADPTGPPVQPDPCEPVNACLVEGIDLDLRSLTLVSTDTDAASGLPLVPGDSIRATATVLNRGSRRSEGGTIVLEVKAYGDRFVGRVENDLPALEPGQQQALTLAVPVWVSSLSQVRDERLAVLATIYGAGDTIVANDRRTSSTHIIAAPILQLVASAGEGRVGASVPVSLTIINYSTTRSQPAALWVACFFDSFRSCAEGGRSPSGTVLLPAVPAAGRISVNAQVPVPPEAAYLDEAFTYSGYLCRVDDPTLGYAEEGACFSIGNVTIRPDYEAVCAPPLLTGAPAHLAAWNCGNPHQPRTELRPPPFHLLALDAAAGVTYRIERSTGGSAFRFYDVRGEPVPDLAAAADELRVGASERIYVVSYSAAANATFRAVPLAGAGS